MEEISSIINAHFSEHPFINIPTMANYKNILENYFAMSQAFPYLQAGSQKDLFLHYMNSNQDVPEHIELTSVVGNFLCWDETGALYPTIALGLKALPHILETRRFHSNLLRKDCEFLFNEPIAPQYSAVTKSYLNDLYDGLSSLCQIKRVATMVSFENHANKMISALWDSLIAKFKVKDKALTYFMMHVGGDDPAEAYHVEMTQKLIERTIPEEKLEQFYETFKSSYALHHQWCESVVKSSIN